MYRPCLLLLSLLLVVAARSAEQTPNVLMIAVDDLRPMLGCYGDPRAKTPNMDRLAAKGVLFERAYCQYAKCGASRLSIMTGLRPDSINAFGHNAKYVKAFRERRPDAVSMARWFKEHGYYARGLGKIYHDGWDLDSNWSVAPNPGRDREMWEIHDEKGDASSTIIAERWDCPVLQAPDVADDHFFAGRMTKEALSILREPRRKKPLFLAVGYRRPHLPFVAPRRYFDLHQPDESWLAKNPDPPIGAPVMGWFNSAGYVGGAKRAGLTMPNPPTRKEGPLWNGYEMRSYLGVPNHGPIDVPTQLNLLQAYAACVSYVDAQIGRLLDELDRTDRWQDTIVILWSDHGWQLGEHSAWSKMTNYEMATRVPFIVAAPKIKPARTRNIAELVDLYPTLCELTGLERPKHLEGESLVKTLENPSEPDQSVALSQHARFREQYMGRALRTDRFRYVAWFERKTGKVVKRELYDHQVDPLETRNLVREAEYSNEVGALNARLLKEFGVPQ